MRLVGVLLAPGASLDNVDSIGVCGGPVEAMSHSLGDERAGAGVVAAVTGVDVVEDLASFGGLDATLEHAGDIALVELAVDDGVRFASTSDHPSFRLVCLKVPASR